MHFGKALEAMQEGQKVSRAGWNGKGLSAFITDLLIAEHKTRMFVLESDRGFSQWVPSASDLLAEDWEVVCKS